MFACKHSRPASVGGALCSQSATVLIRIALRRSNGEAQPSADEYGVLKRYGEQHESAS
jgi:hypothetical protein